MKTKTTLTNTIKAFLLSLGLLVTPQIHAQGINTGSVAAALFKCPSVQLNLAQEGSKIGLLRMNVEKTFIKTINKIVKNKDEKALKQVLKDRDSIVNAIDRFENGSTYDAILSTGCINDSGVQRSYQETLNELYKILNIQERIIARVTEKDPILAAKVAGSFGLSKLFE